jgi:hypothetical protein
LHPLAGSPDQVDHHIGHFDEGRRLRRRRFGVLFLAMAAHQEEPTGAGAEDCDETRHRNDQLELALFRRRGFCAVCAFRLLIVSHCPARFDSEKRTRLPPAWVTMPPQRETKAASAHALSIRATLG